LTRDCSAKPLTAAALTGTLRAYLFDVRGHDVLTFILAPVLLGIVAFMAVWILLAERREWIPRRS
jgi:hypothetical protein